MKNRTRSTSIAVAVTAAASAAVGVVLGYLFDPDRGNARRHRLADQAAAKVRRSGRGVAAKARYQRGRLRGISQRAAGGGVPYPTDDVDVKQQIHQALHRAGVAMDDVSVEVSDRIAVLRGQLATSAEIGRAEKLTGRVPGVHRVESFLHKPGEPAPNKVQALRVAPEAPRGHHVS